MAQHVPVLVTLGTLVDIEPFEGHEEVKDNVDGESVVQLGPLKI